MIWKDSPQTRRETLPLPQKLKWTLRIESTNLHNLFGHFSIAFRLLIISDTSHECMCQLSSVDFVWHNFWRKLISDFVICAPKRRDMDATTISITTWLLHTMACVCVWTQSCSRCVCHVQRMMFTIACYSNLELVLCGFWILSRFVIARTDAVVAVVGAGDGGAWGRDWSGTQILEIAIHIRIDILKINW